MAQLQSKDDNTQFRVGGGFETGDGKKNQTFFHRVGNQEKLKAPLIAEWIIHGDLFKPWDMLSCKRNKLQLHALE